MTRPTDPADSTPEGAGGTLETELRVRALEVTSALSDNDRRIMDFLVEHMDEVGIHTVESISQGVGVSAAAVVRFSRRLGYSGFRELRDRARAHWRAAERSDHDAGGPADSLLSKKIETDTRSLGLLPSIISAELIDDVIGLLTNAQQVWVVGHRETLGLALYFQRLLHNVRSNVHILEPGFPDPLRDLVADDVVFACTFRPYAPQTIRLLPEIRAAESQLIVLTDGGAHGFLSPSDRVLVAPVESPSVFLSLVPAMVLCEAIAGSLARQAPDRSSQMLEQTSALAQRQGFVQEA